VLEDASIWLVQTSGKSRSAASSAPRNLDDQQPGGCFVFCAFRAYNCTKSFAFGLYYCPKPWRILCVGPKEKALL
jgi:hypothetical protein